MRAERRVSVKRNRYGRDRDEHPWHVFCEHCTGSDFLSAIVARPKGWAPTWAVAQQYAIQHARAHEMRRCVTCHHVPTGPLPEEAKR